ncbi:MAG: hypothetical protein ACE37B_08630 [Ilumatobacter sp.]|jgi:hypothetical protein|uniref:hypothetical protein n=1 Tax=Ilumatobacter sp. TaxID=1967498 RepID=UPI00391C2AEA
MTSFATLGPLRIAAVVAACAVSFGACATTVNDDSGLSEADLTGGEGRELADDDVTPLDPDVIVDPTSPTTTMPIEGTAGELLPEIGIDMSRLSAEIGGDGDEDATIARIEGAWDAIRDEVAATRPELVNSIGVAIELARNAVDTNRPADANKAFSLINDLVDAFTGDS